MKLSKSVCFGLIAAVLFSAGAFWSANAAVTLHRENMIKIADNSSQIDEECNEDYCPINFHKQG